MLSDVNKSQLKHVAIIMDGNGRWAQERSHGRLWGHIRGSKVVSEIVEEADAQGIHALTLYEFSTANWSRPPAEVKILLAFLKKYIAKEKSRIIKNRIRFKVIGNIAQIPDETQTLVRELEEITKSFDGLKLTFAFGYGGRSEIMHAINSHIIKNPGKEMSELDLNENLFTSEIGDVDLVIRTGGDQRISNFLLWQIAYAELYFTKTKWPDFTPQEFVKICTEVSKRERRFGAVLDQSELIPPHWTVLNKEIFSQVFRTW